MLLPLHALAEPADDRCQSRQQYDYCDRQPDDAVPEEANLRILYLLMLLQEHSSPLLLRDLREKLPEVRLEGFRRHVSKQELVHDIFSILRCFQHRDTVRQSMVKALSRSTTGNQVYLSIGRQIVAFVILPWLEIAQLILALLGKAG